MKVQFKVTPMQAKELGYTSSINWEAIDANADSRSNFYWILSEGSNKYDGEFKLSIQDIIEAMDMNDRQKLKNRGGLRIEDGEFGLFKATGNANISYYLPLKGVIIINSTRHAAQQWFKKELDFMEANGKWEYLETKGVHGMRPWETRDDFLMRKFKLSEAQFEKVLKSIEETDCHQSKNKAIEEGCTLFHTLNERGVTAPLPLAKKYLAVLNGEIIGQEARKIRDEYFNHKP